MSAAADTVWPVIPVFDYPSQRSGRQFPADPTLLDTCTIQHLKLVMDTIAGDEYVSDAAAEILLRYPAPLGPELVALGDLVAHLRHEPPWVVSEWSLLEFERVNGPKGRELRQWWHLWADWFDGCLDSGWYPGLDRERLLIRQAPSVADGQQAFDIAPPQWPLDVVPPFEPFRDAGDRALIRAALRAGVPTILTTDLNSLWRHRRALYPLGIEVWRPTDVWTTLVREAA